MSTVQRWINGAGVAGASVLPDANLEFAANHITAAAHGPAGRRCMAISVAVVVDSIGDELVDLLKRRALVVDGRSEIKGGIDLINRNPYGNGTCLFTGIRFCTLGKVVTARWPELDEPAAHLHFPVAV
ncbi:aldehyde dehydrogenase family protein [Actinoplanes sp. TFC3]|uniref:aldehyde dehydrogenase family protein n=1 Tax=Actinoplanes sp. TFC3 TaxID=1710355 RepID=UPI00082B9F8F|nr:aldehyde dehydrogenase family protein [Actinoplanes sp. TFC3]